MFYLVEQDYHYTRDYSREMTEMKFDMALTVNDVALIVRGDTSVVDPRAVWHGQAWSRYYEERPYVKPLPDLSGRHVFHQDFGIANDAESDQTGLVTGDGLDNYTEILIGTNPRDYDSNNNGMSDVDEDFDGDGLSNGDEQGHGSHPAYPDTDDDGMPDGDDSAPASSLAPPVDRVLVLTGGYVEMPNQSRFALADWTIQAWVKPAAAGAGGTVICREVAPGVANYCLGLVAGVPVVRFTPFDRTADIAAAASAALAADEWTHLAASFDGVSGRLSIFVNGDCVATTLTVKHPAASGSGPVRIRVGEGFAGLIDEVAIFGRELNEGDIMQLMHGVGYSATRYAGLVSYYRFDDGTSATGPDDQDRHTGTSGMETWWMGQVEEFAPGYGCDWLADWSNGGTLVGAVAMVEADSPVSFTSGESYTDYDYTEDWWELLFGLTVASPSDYDSHLDPDGDGWDNWSEARYAAVTNDVTASLPDAAESTPIPQVRFTFGYTGALKNGPLVVMAYSRQSMDGEPDATFVLAPLTVDLTTVSATVPSSGRLRQGRNWFFAFIDLDGSGTWNEGEPAGLSERFPYDVGWDRNTVAFTLTDKPVNGFVRFSWPADPAKLSYVVSIRRMTYGPNYTTNYTTIFAKAIGAPRNWIHEGDILDGAGTYGGGNPGLDWGGVIDGATPIPIGSTSTYDLRVDNVTVVPFFQIHYIAEGSQLPMPTVDSPYGGAVQTRPRTEFQWRMSTYASAFELQIAPTNSLAPIYSSGIIAAPPPRDFGNDGTGLRVWSPPVHWGDILPGGALTGPMYRWRVRALQPRDPNGAFGPSPSTFTDFAYLRVDLGGNSTDLGSIEVPLTALYLPAGALIRVQAFETASFNDVPVAQKTLRNVSVLPQTVTLEGLAVNAPHYIAAYIDQSGNNAREVWESWGYHRSATAFPRWHYQPMDVMPGRAPQMPSATLTILHVDSDQDRIPDAYEYAMSGGLAGVPDVPTWLETLGLVPDGALSGSRWTDHDGDGLDDMREFSAGTDARLSDTDGDGITDSQEVAIGLSATRADELRVTGLGADPAAVSWAWTTPEGAPDKRVGVYATQEAVVSPPARLNTAVRYVLERTDSLSAPQWVVVAEATTDLTSGAYDIGADMTARPAGFYRVRAILP